MPGMQTPRTHLANGHIQMNDHRRRVRLNLAFGQTARGWTSGPGALPQATMDIAVGEQNVMDIAVGEQNVIISPLANKRLANGHVQHSQGQRPWNMNNNHKTFGQRPYSIAGRGPKFAAITITTVRAFDLQHQGSVSVFEGRYTRTGPRLPCDDAA